MPRANAAPEVTLPEKIGTNCIARYRFRWLDPSWPRSKDSTTRVPALLDIEVDASSGQIRMVSFVGAGPRRPPSRVNAQPPLRRNPHEPEQQPQGGKIIQPSEAYTAAFLRAIPPI